MKAKFASVPYLLGMVIFTIVPMLLILLFAFTSPEGGFTIANISAVGRYTDVIMKSIWLAAIATVICLLPPLGAPAAGFADAHHAADVDELSAAHLRLDDAARKDRAHQPDTGGIRHWPL